MAVFTYDLDSFVNKVKTTTGTSLYLSLDATHTPEISQFGDDLGITLETRTASETHGWDFTLTGGSFSPTAAGGGTLSSGTGLGPFGAVKLALAPVGAARKTVCSSDNYTVHRTERLTGTLDFKSLSTGPHAWGDVGSATRNFAFDGTTTMDIVYGGGCEAPRPTPTCTSGFSWDVSSSRAAAIDFSGGTPFDGRQSLFAVRSVNLSTPKGATRVDLLLVTVPAPTLTVSGGRATIKIRTAAPASGSGTETSKGAATTSRSTCKSGHTTGHETDTTWSAAFARGPSTLRATGAIEGTITLPATHLTGSIDRTTT
jgi:hypothetical protein